IVANEPNRERRTILFSNINRCGVCNAIITGFDGRNFPGHRFDRILVDAPCTDIGAVKKDKQALKNWNLNWIKKRAFLQKALLGRAFELLKPGGELVYSTCTSTIEENEEVILDLLNKQPGAKLKEIKAPIRGRKGLLEGTEKCLRIYPWDNETEFFFIAKIWNG
ncbi:MAG: tRNA methyltransferase, partial [Candidatus Altiarchaeota archaeon]|nr:tRNA methyltransferase [Candidatus Altiarchaeota archaeon]